MEIDLNTWNRYELFKHFDEETNPFLIINTPIDITNIYNHCKQSDDSIYATIGYVINKAVNQVDGFKYRKENNKIIKHEVIHSNYTENIDNETIGFFRVEFDDNYRHYMETFNKERQLLFDNKGSDPSIITSDEIWMSCAPWFNINSLVPPYNKDNTIPQFIWDRFKKENNKVTINLMIMVHHGFIDGYGVGKCIEAIQNEINNFKGDE